MYLVDTNVVSESRKAGRADPGVRRFLAEHPDALYLSVQSIGEIQQGIERLRRRGDRPQAALLETWLAGLLRDYADRILDFDAECARVWGLLMGRGPQNPIDKQIAAIALLHDLVVVTRNVEDFADTGARLLDPFDG